MSLNELITKLQTLQAAGATSVRVAGDEIQEIAMSGVYRDEDFPECVILDLTAVDVEMEV